MRSRLAGLWSSRRVRLVARAFALGWIVFFWVWLIGAQSNFAEVDAEAYWGLTLDNLYRGVQLGDQDAFLYSPVVAYLFLPFSALPYEVFYAILAAVNLAALVWILRPELAALSLFLVPVSNEVARGNIHILIAAAIVLGFHYYGSWAWVILTKVTPGIGVLWFGVRREWRSLAIALGVTGAIVAVSVVLTPGLWLRWLDVLTASVEITRPSVIEIPVLPRLAVAAVLIAIAARRSWFALVPVACMLALPAIWVNSLAMLVAVVPLLRYSTTHRRPPVPDEPGVPRAGD
ncbi:MAG TPA: glycosyltransferase family 87 protein [Candidatus Limnocylindria bacterium]|nr:glycosyltransferase family 87 protein [Candidatus Limnocylindria bacterium]